VPSGNSTLDFLVVEPLGLGKNFPQSTKGVNVNTVPAAANNFKKSLREILSSPLDWGCPDITITDEKIYYKSLF
jgi:hypothetical protein